MKANDYILSSYGFDSKIVEFVSDAESKLAGKFDEIRHLAEINHLKVIKAFQDEGVSERHFHPSTGYGYSDDGKIKLSSLFSRIFRSQGAIAGPMIASGTHAITLCLFGLLRPLDTLLSITGKPYDTLMHAIGKGDANTGSLKDFAISYMQIDLLPDGGFDYFKIINNLNINDKIKMAYIQRSRGYELRRSLSVNEISKIIRSIKKIRPDVIVMVDNCYGEFCEITEPIEAGADIIAGSLIKNPGGGLAPTGGYIAGKESLVDLTANRLTSPVIGAEVGSYNASYLPFFQGLYMAPIVTAEAIKGAMLTSKVFYELGYEVMPQAFDERPDITQSIVFNDENKLLTYIKAIQKSSAVDSHVEPIPWDMPGYDEKIIMAAGAFIQGSSIELSADGPVKPPYIAFVQGGLSYIQHKLGLITALNDLKAL